MIQQGELWMHEKCTNKPQKMLCVLLSHGEFFDFCCNGFQGTCLAPSILSFSPPSEDSYNILYNITILCRYAEMPNLTDFEDEILRVLPAFQGRVHSFFWKGDSFPCACDEVLALRAVNSSALQWARILSGAKSRGSDTWEFGISFKNQGFPAGTDIAHWQNVRCS